MVLFEDNLEHLLFIVFVRDYKHINDVWKVAKVILQTFLHTSLPARLYTCIHAMTSLQPRMRPCKVYLLFSSVVDVMDEGKSSKSSTVNKNS